MTTTTDTQVPVLTVTQLTHAIKFSLESAFPNIWLQGEISNAKLHSSGHFYFSLKDASSQISALMYKTDAQTLKAIPKDGAQVLVRGEINVYPVSGKYQILVREMRLMGVGELLLRLEELKIKLHKRGWFKAERKRPLPKMPKRIGIVTSPTGAAIQDILHVLNRRFSGVHVILNPVKVQGEGSAQEIAQAINQFNQHNLVDVMIVGRGGGSIEDLWAFNEEVVAEAIFNSKIPVVCAVGHETDHCIAEYVADVRAPTPSAAAEIVIAEKAHHVQHLEQITRRLHQTIDHLVRQNRRRLEGIMRHPLVKSPFALLGLWMQKVDQAETDLNDAMRNILERKKILLDSRSRHVHSIRPTAQITLFRQKIHSLDKQLDQSVRRGIHMRWERLRAVQDTMRAIDPKNLLTKGYSILFSEKDGSVITSVQQAKSHQQVRTVLADGHLISTINEVVLSEQTRV